MTRFQFRDFVEQGAVDIVMPDVGWTGGLSEARRIAALAEAHQLPVAPHDCTGPVTLFASAHLCMSTTNVMVMETTRQYYEGWYGEIVTSNIRVENGHLLSPVGPGLGTQLRPEVFDRPDVHLMATTVAQPHYLGWAM